MELVVHIDGGARGNPGPAGVGVVVQTADDGTYLHRRGYFLGETTNNVAEYNGLLHALELVSDYTPNAVRFVSDSQLMVKQINGEYKVKDAKLKPLFAKAKSRLADLPRWEVTHVKREQNQTADELANAAMDARADVDLDAE